MAVPSGFGGDDALPRAKVRTCPTCGPPSFPCFPSTTSLNFLQLLFASLLDHGLTFPGVNACPGLRSWLLYVCHMPHIEQLMPHAAGHEASITTRHRLAS